MAAATAGSSSGGGDAAGSPADSYIGSLISLTSKSEIRYEGVLFNINTHDSTIGLRNVRSFGTEGRKKDGPQIPASDKIYEFILFRGSDIKDLQVKSSPPVQSTTPIHNDPAIIQSHYPQVTSVSTSLPVSGTGSVPDFNSHNTSLGVPRPTFPSSLPLYQPGQTLGSWGSSHPPPPPSANGSGLAMPMYWQGYYGPSNGMQAQQQTLFQGPPGLSVPPSVQQPTLYPSMNSTTLSTPLLSENPPPLMPPFSTGNMNLQSSTLATLYPPMNSTTHSTPMLSENPPPSLPPLSTSIMNLQSSTPSMRTSAIVLDSANSIPDKPSGQALPAASLSSNLSLVSPLTTALEKSGLAEPGFDKPKTVVDPVMPFKSISEPPSRIMEASNSILGEGAKPSLITPGQFLQPGPPTVPSGQSPQISLKDVEVVQMSPVESPPLPKAAAGTEKLEPILPLPTQTERKLHGAPMYTNHASRGGREMGRGNGISRSATRFTEDFDFTAMNEKFNKDEVWGHLGKSSKAQEDGEDLQDEDDSPLEKFDKPVYVKDDFFDSLSCDALGGGSRGGRGRGRFSEQMRRDTETFGDFSRYRGGRGGWGPGRGGRSRGGGGGYHGRGYGYVGRGRGYSMPGRAI